MIFAGGEAWAASCGSANGQGFYTAPTDNLCSPGYAYEVSGSGPWTWTCYGWAPKGSTKNWVDVAVSSDGKYITALAANDQVYISSDYGKTWTARGAVESEWKSVAMSSNGKYQTAYAIGKVYRSIDYGVTWTLNNPPWSFPGDGAVSVSSTGQYQLVGQLTSAWKSTDYGASWTQLSGVSGWKGAISSNGQYLTLTSSGSSYIYTSNDYGASWTSRSSSISDRWSVDMSDSGQYQATTTFYGSTPVGYIYTSNDYGVNWTQRLANLPGLVDIEVSSTGQYMIAAASGSQIYVSNDYGVNWITKESSRGWEGVAISADGYHKAVVVYGGQIYISHNDDGSNASCSATLKTDGSCGTAQGHGYPSTSYIDTSAERCSAGTFTSFTDNGSSWSWSCNGINGGTNASCSANKVACGSYHTTIRRDQPSSNLCSYGNNTTLSLDSGIWYWMCTNNPGENVACYTYKTACGSANGGTYSSPPSTPAELCAYGSASSVTTGETTYTWTCTGNDSLAVSCSATRSGTVVNGSCGTAQGQLYSTPPSGDSNLCSAGSPSLVTSGSLAYTWTCAGSGGGSNANCSADRISFKNPSDLDTGNTDESCFYCDYYYDSNGYLQKGNLDTANKQAVPRLGFTVDNTKYSNYKIKIGNVEVASWIPISSSTVTYDGLRVKEGATSDSVSDSILTITYGNGTAAKTYGWYVKLQKTGGGETDWLSAGTFDTPKKPYPIVKIATASPTVYINSNVQYCTTTTTLNRATDTSNCFDICWKGTGDTADLSSSDWKCSVCFDSSANRTLCSISNSNQFSWNLPTAVGSYQNSTSSTSSNPVFKYTASIGSLKPGLAVAGSECAAEGETGTKTPLPIWRETAP